MNSVIEPIITSVIYSIIESVEVKENKPVQLENAITTHRGLVVIDFEELKSSPRLNGARIFKTLFNINNDSSFAKKPMDRDKNGYLTILKTYNINILQWKSFMNFVRYGRIKYYNLARMQARMHIKIYENCEKCLYREINELYMGIFGTFGPFPVFDKFCENIENSLSKIKQKNDNRKMENANPMTPMEDINNKYLWQACYTPHFDPNNNDWSCTIPAGDSKYYWRKPIPPTTHT